MKIKITSDSTCDLSPELLRENDIELFPLFINKGDESFRDGVDIQPADIFAHVAAGGALCSTAAVPVGVFHDRFAELAKEYDAVFHVNIGSGFSASHQNAVLAAEDLPNVYVIDSRNLSTGQGHVVLEACRLAKTATDPEEMYRQLNAFAPTVDASFLLDRLDYMVKGGRCSSVVALGANLLRLKPCIEVVDNKMIVGKKYRGSYVKCMETVWRTATTCCTTRSSSRTRPSRRRSLTPCTAPCASAVISSIFMRQTRAARSRATAARARSACCTCTSPRTDIRTIFYEFWQKPVEEAQGTS